MITFSRRNFLFLMLAAPLAAMRSIGNKVVTVKGVIGPGKLGKVLIHEHVLVDFIGADKINPKRWDRTEVVNRMAPYFAHVKAAGIKTVVECTPAFLGRDALLLKMLSDKTGIQFITNTGYYGAGNNKFLPPWAFTESAEQIAQRWIDDFDYGIDGTNIRPGFIKISVDASAGGLSDIHQKLVRAAAITHLKTGLVIYSHTGASAAAFEQMEILQKHNVHPSAFVWVHAQAEKARNTYIQAAKMGAWISLDGITADFDDYATMIAGMKNAGLLHRVLISHDAGWYRPGEKEGGEITGYTSIFTELLPRLTAKGFDKKDIKALLVRNPANLLSLNVRNLR